MAAISSVLIKIFIHAQIKKKKKTPENIGITMKPGKTSVPSFKLLVSRE